MLLGILEPPIPSPVFGQGHIKYDAFIFFSMTNLLCCIIVAYYNLFGIYSINYFKLYPSNNINKQ